MVLNEDKCCDTHDKYQTTQVCGHFESGSFFLRTLNFAFEGGTDNKHRNNHAYKAGYQSLNYDIDSGDLSADPQHDGGDVTDG